MKLKILLSLLSAHFYFLSSAQNFTGEIESLCDTAYTQADLNICTYAQYQKLDSIINVKNKTVIKLIEDMIDIWKDENDPSYSKTYEDMLTSFLESDKTWRELKKQNSDIYYYYYYQGSVRSMTVNKSAILEAQNRIVRLDDFIELLSQ